MGLEGSTQIPALMALGFWWGRLGRSGTRIEGIFNLGLLAWLGTVIVGLSLWIQIVLIQSEGILYKDWGLSTLLAQTIVTALLAPIICSWLLLYWRGSAFKKKG